MTAPRTSEDVVRHALAGIAEAVRAVSGLFAVIVLGGIAAGTALSGYSEPADASRKAQAGDFAERPLESLVQDEPERPVMVFFLVSSVAQAHLAGLAEQEVRYMSGRSVKERDYEVLYARTDDELRLAATVMLERSLAVPASTLVQVADLRGVKGTW